MTLAYPVPRAKQPLPFVRRSPSFDGGNIFTRLLAAHVIAHVTKRAPSEIVARQWPSDRTLVELIERAAVAPAMTTVTGWAAELAQRVVADALEALAPASAAAQLFQLGLSLSFDSAATLGVPGFLVNDTTYTGVFVAEGQPIPVFALGDAAAALSPHKIAGIFALTREMIDSSNAEKLIADVVVRNLGRAVDEVLVDGNPGDASRPAGLRNGIAALTPSANADLDEAFYEDIVTLINSVARVGGAGPYVFIASPGRAAAMQLRAAQSFSNSNLHVLGSSAVVNDLIVVAAAALVSAVGSQPDVESANAATLHMDTVPQAVGSAGPGRALWQTDTIGVKVRWPLSWALRDPRGFAWMTPVWK